jgi:hypothetical protein
MAEGREVEGEGDGGIVLAGPWIMGDRATVAVVSPLSIVPLWHKFVSSLMGKDKHEAGPVPI